MILKKNCEERLLKSIINLKQDFSILPPISQFKDYGFLKKDITETEGVQGFAMLINRSKIIQAGMFDKNIFLYAEELDFCKRLRLNSERFIKVI